MSVKLASRRSGRQARTINLLAKQSRRWRWRWRCGDIAHCPEMCGDKGLCYVLCMMGWLMVLHRLQLQSRMSTRFESMSRSFYLLLLRTSSIVLFFKSQRKLVIIIRTVFTEFIICEHCIPLDVIHVYNLEKFRLKYNTIQ